MKDMTESLANTEQTRRDLKVDSPWNGPKYASLSQEQKDLWNKYPIKELKSNPIILEIPDVVSLAPGLKDETQTSPGLKNDNAKSRVDLLDPDFLLAVGDALRFGAEKYKEHGGSSNWRRGINISRLVASALRHLLAIMRGEDIDSESGLPHTAHLGCCVQFLHWTLKHKPEFDDRFKYGM